MKMYFGSALLGLVLLFGCGQGNAHEGTEDRILKSLVVSLEKEGEAPFVVSELDYNESGLKVEERRYNAYRAGKFEGKVESKYDEEGKGIEQVHYFADGRVNFVTEYFYDENDSVLGYRSFNGNRELTFTVHVHYDSTGFNDYDRAVFPDNSPKFRDEYKKDEAGFRGRWIRLEAVGEGLDAFKEDLRIDFERDSKGNVTRRLCSGRMGGNYEYVYDTAGRKVEAYFTDTESIFEGQEDMEEVFISWKMTYEYNPDGRLAKRVKHETQLLEQPKKLETYTYVYTFWD